MIERTLLQVQEMVGGNGLDEKWESLQIKGVSIDSRSIQPGNLYIPIQGERFDGHSFVANAVDNGAAATFWKQDVPNPPTGIPVIFVEDTLHALQSLSYEYRSQLSIRVIGITGSNGKTSTKDILTGILATTYKVQKTEGNLNNHIGLPLTILRLEEDTEMAVIEMGMSSFGEIEFLSKLARPNAAIITNIGESHLMDLGSREGIAKAKTEIVTGLQQNGLFVYNGDEPLLANRVPQLEFTATIATFGNNETNDYFPTRITTKENGTEFSMNQAPETSFFIPVLGKYNVYNTLACMAVASFFGVTWKHVKEGLAHLQMTRMRMEMVHAADGLTIINDAYNASPTSMKAALTIMKDMHGYKKKIVVLGTMLELGDQEEQFHYEVGTCIDPQFVDYVFTYGELGKQIAKGAHENFDSSRVMSFTDKEELASELRKIACSHDVILLKASRGMKLEELIPLFG
ncbi:UDP-N-acetylmuramoyl-tripeptide--D-alanyl-D-alanine ligase [Ectobacillus sp. sgz5001026]|uniref:UDP-N-acetylmuramoyl-tripeptide--D-alanyl-D- alanine ligase n=1 Tax=Ectobacillus sp. sgz5001026 TaxID=3242473 RepID=UPI0036D4140D